MRYLLFFILFSNLLLAKPFSPESLDDVIFTLEANTAESKQISLLLQQIEKEPSNLEAVDQLLSLYIKLGKSKADTSYLGYAKAFLAPYLLKYPNAYGLTLHQVDILQHTHHFDEALHLLKSLTAKNIKALEPYLMTAIIYQAKEDYVASLSACKKLLFRSSHLISATCLSFSQSYLGKLPSSYALLQDVYAKAKKEDQHEKSWALTSLADMAYRLEKKEASLAYLKEALALDVKDYFVLKKMSELYLEQKKYEKVKVLLAPYEYVDALLLRLTVAKEKLGEEVGLAKENLKSLLKTLKLSGESPHKEDLPYFKMLGIK
ncbi:MAG: Unknown protein [uncultured Sulfurovum sp.]|uniref:Uncharacterized protein n=1 Tax=uncultured Sulfurovum sp. TaxID=269237 RepID=A0A6S6TX42_9BACT|nr:MAG: Unknown protein [uncultured Sulfurovum sp.]